MLKKVLLLWVCILLLASLLCGCQTPSDEPCIPGTESSENEPVSPWKTAYLNYLEQTKGTYTSFALVYIDGDDIPELYLGGNSEAVGDAVCAYKNGKVIEQVLNRTCGGKYVEKSGLLMNQNGNSGRFYTSVYALTDAGFSQTFHALSEERVEYLENDEFNYVYTYFVADEPVNESDYVAAVDAAFPVAQAVNLHENAVTFDTIKQQIAACK